MSDEAQTKTVVLLPDEVVAVADLKPHPRNYQKHPEDEIEHLRESLREYGMFRNIVVARDNTILAGHGVTQAAALEGVTEITVKRVDLDPSDPDAIKLVVLDNEIGHLAERDDRLLTELLRYVNEEASAGLLGTGFDEMMLANLLMVTRPTHEIADHAEAAAWVGMPEWTGEAPRVELRLYFDTEEQCNELVEQLSVNIARPSGSNGVMVAWWPPRGRDDARNVMFEG
jgi:hypothetical protein